MEIKIISLNLWHGGRLFEPIVTFLKAQDADILVLQEVYNGTDPALGERHRSVAALQERLPYPHATFAQAFVLDQPEGKLPMGNAVLSKLPVTPGSVNFFVEPEQAEYQDVPEQWPRLPRLLQEAEVQVGDKTIRIFNIQGVWDLAGDEPSPARQKMVDTILRAVDSKPNAVLVGDTNAKFSNPAMRRLEGPLRSVFGDELRSTFNMKRKTNPGYATAAVDLMYVTPDIKIIDWQVPDVDISDHLPLVVRLHVD